MEKCCSLLVFIAAECVSAGFVYSLYKGVAKCLCGPQSMRAKCSKKLQTRIWVVLTQASSVGVRACMVISVVLKEDSGCLYELWCDGTSVLPSHHQTYIIIMSWNWWEERKHLPYFCKLLTCSQVCSARTQIWQWCKEIVLKVDRRCMSYITPLPPWICSRRGREGYLRTDCDTKSLEFVWKSTADFRCINYCKRKH